MVNLPFGGQIGQKVDQCSGHPLIFLSLAFCVTWSELGFVALIRSTKDESKELVEVTSS